jgi:WD40 repeat protein
LLTDGLPTLPGRLRQNAHVLAPLQPPGSLAATFASRLAGTGELVELRNGVLDAIPGPHLRIVTAPPDLPHRALSRVLAGHIDRVVAFAIASDGAWLASASWDGTVRIWDPATGHHRHTLTGHTDEVAALAVASDGTWLASAGRDSTVRIWDPTIGQARDTLAGHTDRVVALAVAPDGTWLGSASWDGTVRIWDPTTGHHRHTLTGHTSAVAALAAALDGTWLASASWDGTVRIWDPTQGQLVCSFRVGHALRRIEAGTARITAAGDRGPYFLSITSARPGGTAAT